MIPEQAKPAELSIAGNVVQHLADYGTLMKPRIIMLLLITGYCAMVVAADGIPAWNITLFTLLGLALSSGGANAVNMWYDQDIDRVMHRTQHRPVPSGRLLPQQALAFGVTAEAVSIILLWYTVGPLPALLSVGGYVYYVFIYTMWLKRRTPQNIVIGGGAGAFPPLVGWTAVTGHLAWAPVLMFLIVFFWTPPHFWALALYKNDDYTRAKVPMMPVVRGPMVTKRQSLGYTVLLLLASAALYWTGTVGPYYLAAALGLGLGFIGYGIKLWREPHTEMRWAKLTFRYSLVYLSVLFAAMVLNVKP